MTNIYHIPTDEEAGKEVEQHERRVIFLCTCAICKQDYEVRDGDWLPMYSKKGTEIKIKVCGECFSAEMNSV